MIQAKAARGSDALAVQLAALAKMTLGWKLEALWAEIDEKKSRFAANGHGDQCLELPIGSLLGGIGSVFENVGLASAFEHPDKQRLAQALRNSVAYRYLHYRLLRIVFKVKRGKDLYGLMLEEFGFAACAAIYCGLPKEASWLGREFLRHMEAGYECPYSANTALMNACRGLAEWHLKGEDPIASRPLFEGRYRPMAQALEENSWDPVDKLLVERTQGAYKKWVRDSGTSHFSGSIFTALFPFEVLAFLKLAGKASGFPMGWRTQPWRTSPAWISAENLCLMTSPPRWKPVSRNWKHSIPWRPSFEGRTPPYRQSRSSQAT